MRIRAMGWGFLVLAGILAHGLGQEAASRAEQVRKLLGSLHFQSGAITVGDGLATLNLPPSLQYLDPTDARAVLVDLWGNPPGSADGTLGLIVPAGVSLVAENSWAVVVSYEEDGHVKDDDAEKINYDKLLSEMQKETAEDSAKREKEGYESIRLVGWAAPPKYDAEGKKLHWAKELEFGGSSEHTLNYNIRILGRKGVLVLNAVAARKDLPVIEAATPALLAAVSFNPGHRYADFNASTDKMAAYGIAALVAGGIAAKAGLFKGLWLAVLAMKKFIILGLAAVGGFVAKFFKKKSGA